VSEEKLQDAGPKADAGESKGKDVAGRSREVCLCGHRATVHAAYRYACQAPGNRKGYCPCMRFVARNSPIGKRLRTAGPASATGSGKSA
jgi:hypothetical protein